MPKPYTVQDRYFHKAKAEGLRARSAFKLDEIQEKFRLVKPGHTVADLGAAPGSWSQRLSRWVGTKGRVAAFDLQEMENVATNVECHVADITDTAAMEVLALHVNKGTSEKHPLYCNLPPLAPNVSPLLDVSLSDTPSSRIQHSRSKAANFATMRCFSEVPKGDDWFFDGIFADLAPSTTGIFDADAYHSAELNHAVLDFCERYLASDGYVVTKIFQGEEFAGVVKRAKKMFRTVRCVKPAATRARSHEIYIVGAGFRGTIRP